MSSKPLERPVSSASLSLLFVRFLACLYIYTFQLCFLEFLKAVHFMLVGLLLSDSYQSIFLLWAFFDIQYTEQNSFNYSQEVGLSSKCTQMYRWGQVCKKFVTSVITLNIKQIHFSGTICYFYTLFLVNY